MRLLSNGLKALIIILVLVSIIFFVCSLLEFFTNHGEVSLKYFYESISSYSGLYKFTFIVLAFYLAFQQLKLAIQNNKRTISQLKFTQEDILGKREKEITNETLNHCRYYLNEIQLSYKSLIESGILSGFILDWEKMTSYTNVELEEKYHSFFLKIENIDRDGKNQILILLYKLEAFSIMFTSGNTNLKLGERILGNVFSKQVGFLLGLISFFRKDDGDPFCINSIELYKKWSK